jgi:hypothetical protein
VSETEPVSLIIPNYQSLPHVDTPPDHPDLDLSCLAAFQRTSTVFPLGAQTPPSHPLIDWITICHRKWFSPFDNFIDSREITKNYHEFLLLI